MKKVLAIDYGTKRVGLAVNHAGLAEPLTIVANDENLVPWLKSLIEDQEIELILVGISEQKMAEKTKFFAEKLKTAVGIPLDFFDETLSSAEARKRLAHSSMKLKSKQGPIDHYAAAIFLQDWLDED